MTNLQIEEEPIEFYHSSDIKLPQVVDNTMLCHHNSCPKHFYYRHIQHLEPKEVSIHLTAGRAFANALETMRRLFYTGTDVTLAIEEGYIALIKAYGYDPQIDDLYQNSPKSFDNLSAAYFSATQYWNPLTDNIKPVKNWEGEPLIECNGTIELDTINEQTAEPFLLHGRYDMLAEMNGQHFIEDDKTTTALGANWANQWDLRSQFFGYKAIAEAANIKVDGAIIRGTAILKTKITHAQAITFLPDHLLKEWRDCTENTLNKILEHSYYNFWPKAGMFTGGCFAYFRKCDFQPLCMSIEPEKWVSLYKRRIWDPMNPD